MTQEGARGGGGVVSGILPWGQKEGVEVRSCRVRKRLQKGLKLRVSNRQFQVGDQSDEVKGNKCLSLF